MNQVEVKSRQLQAVSMILTLLTFAVAAKLTGYNGAAYLAAALEAVTAVWIVVGGNLGDSLGRLLRVRNSRGQHKNADRLRRNAMIFQMAFGLAGSLLLLAGAGWITESVFRLRYSTFVLMVLSPVIFLRSVSAVLLGYFQGEGTQLPTAVSGILRQVFILGFSLLFGRLLGNYGEKVSRLLVQENFTSMYGGVGVGIAVSVSELFVVIFLYLIYRGSRRDREKYQQEGMRVAAVSFADSIRLLWSGRGLHWLTEFLLFLPIPLGFVFFQKRGQGDAAVSEYGIYAAMYWVLCGVCASLVIMLLLPVSARTAACLRKDEQRFARTAFQSGIHLGLVHALFASVFLTVMAPQLAGLFSPGMPDLYGSAACDDFLHRTSSDYDRRKTSGSGSCGNIGCGVCDRRDGAFKHGKDGDPFAGLCGDRGAGDSSDPAGGFLFPAASDTARLAAADLKAGGSGGRGRTSLRADRKTVYAPSGKRSHASCGAFRGRGPVLDRSASHPGFSGTGAGYHSRRKADPLSWTAASRLLMYVLMYKKRKIG